MTADTARRPGRRQLEQRGLRRVTEAPPLVPDSRISGVGQSLFSLFHDELMRRRFHAPTADQEVSHG